MPPLIQIVRDDVTPMLRRLLLKLDSSGQRKILLQWGATVRKLAQETAIGKGGRRFWRDIARSTNVREVGAGAVQVASDHVAAAQMQYGGDISAPGKHSADPAMALTIPFPGSAGEGHRTSEFSQKLFSIKSKSGSGILGYAADGDFVPLFILKKRVRGHKDPWFPTQEKAGELGEQHARKVLAA